MQFVYTTMLESTEYDSDEFMALGHAPTELLVLPSIPIKLSRDRDDPIDVYPWFEITVQEIDTAAQKWQASVEIHLFWQDFSVPVLCPNVKTTGFKLKDEENDSPIKLSEIFENKTVERCKRVDYKYLSETSTIYMFILVSVEFVERMELHRFPIDRQFLSMDFNGWTSNRGSNRFNWNWILSPPDWVTNKRFRRPFAIRILLSFANMRIYKVVIL